MDRITIHKVGTGCIMIYSEALSALRSNLRVTSGQLQELSELLRIIFSDENFLTILEIEGVTTIPTCITRKLAEPLR